MEVPPDKRVMPPPTDRKPREEAGNGKVLVLGAGGYHVGVSNAGPKSTCFKERFRSTLHHQQDYEGCDGKEGHPSVSRRVSINFKLHSKSCYLYICFYRYTIKYTFTSFLCTFVKLNLS